MLIPYLIRALSFAFQSSKVHTTERGCGRLKGAVGDVQASLGRQQSSDFYRAAADCRIEYQTPSSCATVHCQRYFFREQEAPPLALCSADQPQAIVARVTYRGLIRLKALLRPNSIDPVDVDKESEISVSN